MQRPGRAALEASVAIGPYQGPKERNLGGLLVAEGVATAHCSSAAAVERLVPEVGSHRICWVEAE
jgi:hypothetical protein